MKTAYYPGCSLEGTSKEFDISLKAVANHMNAELNELHDWSCCGATSAHATNHLLSIALPARNFELASSQGFDSVFAPCAACYNRLLNAKHELKKDEKLRMKVSEIINSQTVHNLEIINILQFIKNIGLENISSKVKINLDGIKAACYYGCLLTRPGSLIDFDDTEQPTIMEEIVKTTGAEPIEWNFKTECCGAAHSIAHTEIVEKLSKKIIDDAAKHGADVIIVACPMCHSNLDMRQRNIKKHIPGHKEMPVLYLTELLGLSFGIDYSKLGLGLHFTNPMPKINSILKKEQLA